MATNLANEVERLIEQPLSVDVQFLLCSSVGRAADC